MPEPIVIRTAYGKWLARSPAWAPIKIGVLGLTEAGAKEAFKASYAVWRGSLNPPVDFQI